MTGQARKKRGFRIDPENLCLSFQIIYKLHKILILFIDMWCLNERFYQVGYQETGPPDFLFCAKMPKNTTLRCHKNCDPWRWLSWEKGIPFEKNKKV